MVLKGASNNLAGRSGAFIDKHYQRHVFQCGGQAFERVDAACAAQVKLGRCSVGEFAFSKLSVGRCHHHVFWQEGSRNRHCCIKQAARVVAQVKHHALEVRLLLVNGFDLGHKIFNGALLKLAQTNPGIARLHHLGANRLCADFFPDDCYRKGAAFVLAENRQHYFAFGLTAHLFDCVRQRQTLDHGVVNFGDQIVGLESGAVGRRAFNRRHHFDQSVFLTDFNAHTNKAARGSFAEFLERFLVKVSRMRVEAGNHASDGVRDQFFLIDRFNIVGLDHAKHIGQLLQLFQRQRCHGAPSNGLQLHRGQRAGDDAD